MKSISALSITLNARSWLVESHQPSILHVFDHACNLINERKEVLSLVTPQIGNGPFNLVVEGDVLFSKYLNIESRISVSPNQLTLDNLIISTKDVKLWSPRPNWEKLHSQRDRILHQLTKLQITNSLSLTGFDTPLGRHSGLLNQRGLPIANYQFSNFLISPLAIADLRSSLTAAKQVAGLGIGLTPSGDDFIMGAIYAAWIVHPPEVASVLAQEIANITAPLTTSLSAEWLRAAGRGEAGILWHEFFDALVSANAEWIHDSANRILVVGETSGADALEGFIRLCTFRREHWSI